MIENFQRSNYFIMLAAGAMLIGFAPIFVKWSELSSSGILFYRMFLTLPFLLALNLIKNKTIFLELKVKNYLLFSHSIFGIYNRSTSLALQHEYNISIQCNNNC